jgi:hypothetical protein
LSILVPLIDPVTRKIFLFHPVAESFGMSTWQVPFSSWQVMLLQLAFFFVFEDMFHYFGSCFALRLPASAPSNRIDARLYVCSTPAPPYTLAL